MTSRRLFLAVAHPDDEAFGSGGMLAKYGADGAEVTVLCTTRGDVGEIMPGVDATPETLGQVREAELREAARILNVHSLVMLGYRDSGMAGTDDNHHPNAFVNAPEERVVAQVVAAMRKARPQVVVTFEPEGGYGHPDHMYIHSAALKAFELCGDPSYTTEDDDPPWTPSKLYYPGIPRSLILQMMEFLRGIDPDSEMLKLDPNQIGMPDELITTRLDVAAHAETRLRAAAAHRSQRNMFDRMPPEIVKEAVKWEFYVRARPEWTPGAPSETDLFDGLDLD